MPTVRKIDAPPTKEKGKRGRPKGSKNKKKEMK